MWKIKTKKDEILANNIRNAQVILHMIRLHGGDGYIYKMSG